MKKFLLVTAVILAVLVALLYRPSIPLDKLKAKYTDEHSRFVEVDGMNVHYRVQGSGPALLLIHGTSSSLHTWEPWADRLSDRFTVYSVDLPGCGLTGPHPDGDYSMTMFLRFLDGFTNNIGLDHFYMAGNSLGGHIVWEYARVSDKVDKAVLVDPSGFYEEDRDLPLVFKLGRKKVFAALVEHLNVGPLIARSLKEVYYDDSLVDKELVRRYKDLLRRKGNRKAFIQKVGFLELSPPEELHDVQVPVLVQWGKQDTWIPLGLSEIFMEHLPDAELIVYDECGHVPQEEIPERSAEDVADFLKGVNVYSFFTGNWVLQNDGTDYTIYETWDGSEADRLTGRSYALSADGKTEQELEGLELNVSDNGWIYTARPTGQPEVDFHSVVLSDDRMRFENETHDFPTYIEYRRRTVDTFDVVIGNADREMPMVYVRSAGH